MPTDYENPWLKKVLKFLPDAQAARSRSKDRSTQVGGVALDDDFNIRGSAYNGFPRGIDDTVESRHQRPLKYKWTSHCEENLVAQAARIGVSLRGCTLLLTSLFPCPNCSRMLIQAGFRAVVAPRTNVLGQDMANRTNWDEESLIAMEMLEEAGISVFYYEEVKE